MKQRPVKKCIKLSKSWDRVNAILWLIEVMWGKILTCNGTGDGRWVIDG